VTCDVCCLVQERFPGVGNWMADEILWRACIHPSKRCGQLSDDEVTGCDVCRVPCVVVMYVFSSFAVLHSVCVWVAKQVAIMLMMTMA
jgi:hypothetical protein